MKTRFFATLLWAALSVGSSHAATIYQNTTNDTLNTIFFSVGAYSQIGDSITLGGTDRFLTTARVQFYNNGSSGTFTATLNFWDASGVGLLPPSPIGSSYTSSGNSINSLDILDVTFSLPYLLAPNNLIFTVAVSNQTSGLDLGLNLFEPPTVGTSNNAAIITRVASNNFVAETTAAGLGNLYLQLDAAAEVPEPATITMAAAALLALCLTRNRRLR